jgi:hypothetical protein
LLFWDKCPSGCLFLLEFGDFTGTLMISVFMGVVLEGLYVIRLGKIINLDCVKFGYLGICLCVCVCDNKI